jgi:hypothetical protein
MKHSFCDNKYTVSFINGRLSATRHDLPWRDLVGDGLVLAMLQEVDTLKEQLQLLEDKLTYEYYEKLSRSECE